MNVHVFYGQGGIVTSGGMWLLANRIRALSPRLNVTTHNWYQPIKINGPTILIGYSLGANAVTWNAVSWNSAPVALAVCYDPSVLSIVTQPTKSITRLLLYHNNDIEPEGHAVFVGPQVETTQISMFHLAVCYSEMLHQKTLAAVQKAIADNQLLA
jgi:hypothetical protein